MNLPAVINRKEKVKHPTQKPMEILRWIIKSSSKPKHVVLDCFMGSGTTAVACTELKRRFIGIEKDKKYCIAANDRIMNINQQKELFKWVISK